MIIISPGTGPVEGATIDHAYANMDALLKDAGLVGATWSRDIDAEEQGGRFSFLVNIPGAERFGRLTVDMPGIPLERVRYTGDEGQNIWDFPRLYVDGSSWVWKFAVNRLRDWVSDNEEAGREEQEHLAELRATRTSGGGSDG